MALKIFTARVTPLSAGNLNRFLALGGSKVETKLVYARVRYTGSVFEVAPATDSAEIVSGHLSFVTGVLSVTLSGYTVAPVALLSPTVATAYRPKAVATSASLVEVRWYNDSNVLVTAADTAMDAYVVILGV